jgi:predicted enzyme related to lactoylglutathione lyase
MAGRPIVHIEIPASSREKAAGFYKNLFDWDVQHIGSPMSYTTFQAGNTGGGFPDVSAHNPIGQILIYIASDDIDADLKKVENLGGKIITPKAEVPGFGWYAVFADPTGNPIALWKGSPQPG